jgi:hypothetical protein
VRPIRSRKKVLLAFLLSGVAAGCLLTTDLSGLSGDSGSLPDGSLEGSSAGDARVDGGTDAGDSSIGPDGSTSPCTKPHAFCADFDTDNPQAGWTGRDDTSVVGTLSFDPLALSPPRSLRAQQPRKTPTPTWLDVLTKRFPSAWKRTVFEGDVYLEAQEWLPGDINVSMIDLVFESDMLATGTVFFISANDAEATIEHIANGPARYLPIARPAYGQWTHVVIDFDPAGHIRYQVGAKTFERDFTPATSGASPDIVLTVGAINFNEPVPAIDVRWDNITVDFP